jgi:molybdate transport system substrate-binding protein
MRLGRVTWIVATAMLFAACANGRAAVPGVAASGAPASGPEGHDVTIYAAASLKAVLARARTVYEAANPGISLTISTDSSAALEAKIEQGAPVDLFLSADSSNPQKLADKGMTAGDLMPFAGNLLAVIVPTTNPAGISAPTDLGRNGVKVIAAGDAVPITRYATQLVENLAAEPGYPADFVARYTANIASKEDNAAAVVAKIAIGEGDAGIVYRTDARTSPAVRMIAVPDGANVPATYAGVVVRTGAYQEAARAFLTWLAGPVGQAVLAEFGFLPPA